jgi:gluconolactonase
MASFKIIALLAAASATAAFATPAPAQILADGAKFEEVSHAGTVFAEGVVAAKDGMVYVSDLTRTALVKDNNPGGTIYRFDPATGQTTKFMEPSGMSNGLHVDKNNDLIICQDADTGGRAVMRRNLSSGEMRVVANAYQGKHLNGTNDCTSDGQGRIYFTDARYGGKEPMELPNAVYRADPDGKVTQFPTDIYRPNGIEVSPGGSRLFVSASNSKGRLPDNPNGPAQDRFGITAGGVAVYDLDKDGNVSNGKLFYRNDELGTDGMTVDTAGNVYIAMHNGNASAPKGEVIVLGPDGKLIQQIALPQPMVSTNLGFGRGNDANSLYLTAAYPWRLFRIRTVKRGLYFE